MPLVVSATMHGADSFRMFINTLTTLVVTFTALPKECDVYILILSRRTTYIYIHIYRVYQEERTRLREGVPCVKLYRKTPKHLYPKLNGYGDNGQRKVWISLVSAYCTLSGDVILVAFLRYR